MDKHITNINRIKKSNNEKEIRIIMSEFGWSSEDRLSDLGWGGKYGYDIWFSRHDWHNKPIYSSVTFHKHSPNLNEIFNVVKDAALLSLKAWNNFTDCVPKQNAYEQLEVDILATKTFNGEKIESKIF